MDNKPAVHKATKEGTACGWGSLASNPKLSKTWSRVTCVLCLKKKEKVKTRKKKEKR